MQTFNWNKLVNYSPSVETLEKALLVTEKMGKLNVKLKGVFKHEKQPSRIFAFIEGKYSSKIEGIYTTLFDVVNTNDGRESSTNNVLAPIIDELLNSNNSLSNEKIKNIAARMNQNINESSRFSEEFGIYSGKGNKRIKIYQPPKNELEVENCLNYVILKAKYDDNIVKMLHTHILFEKVHPFVDGNGRIGRLLLQKSIMKLINFTKTLPLSWACSNKLHDYYQAFDIDDSYNIDQAIQILLDLLMHMYQTTKAFVKEVGTWLEQKMINLEELETSKINKAMLLDILLTLQTKRIYIEKHYNLNVRTIDRLFDKLNNVNILFNTKKVHQQVLFWNLELEELIDKHFKN